MITKETLYELLKIDPSFKDTLKAIINQLTTKQLKLLEVNYKNEKYNFKSHMELYYSKMYPIYSLKETRKKSFLIITRDKWLMENKKFDIDELERFVKKFEDLFTIQKPSSLFKKIFTVLGSFIIGAISSWIGSLFFKKS